MEEEPVDLAVAERVLERALSAGQNRPDRLPGLQMVFTQLPRFLIEELSSLSPVPLKVRLVDLQASTLGETCMLQPNAFAGVARAERWRSWLYFIADPLATALFVEAATGCEGFPKDGIAPRPTTKTDANVIRVLFRRIARSLAASFSLLVDVSFDVGSVVDKIELEPQLSTASPVIAARLSLEYDGNAGEISIIIPQAALEPIRDVLSVAPTETAGSRFRDDPAWSKQLADEIARAFIILNGVLEERTVPLGEVAKFAVGSVVELPEGVLQRVRLDADEIPMFWCELGKRGSTLTLRVNDDFDQQAEAIDEFHGL